MQITKEDWQGRIRSIAKDAGSVRFTAHAWSRMRQRQITASMVLDVLTFGKIVREPELDIRHGDMHCLMEYAVAGCYIGVVVAVENINSVQTVVITSFKIANETS